MAEKTNKIANKSIKNDKTISILDIIFILIKHGRLTLIITFSFTLISLVYVQLFSDYVFISHSKIISSTKGNNMSQAAGIAAQFGINIPSNQSDPQWVYSEIIKSRTLAKAVLNQKFNPNELGSNKSLIEIVTSIDEKNISNRKHLEINAVNKLLSMVDVNLDPVGGILHVKVKADNPILAKTINNAVLKQLAAHQKKYNKENTAKAKKFIEARMITTEKDLIEAEESLKIFRDRNRQIQNSPSLLLEEQRLIREVSVLTGVFTTLKQQYEMTKIDEVKDSDYVIILDNPSTPLGPSSPNKRSIVLLSSLLGLFAGFFISFFLEYLSGLSRKDKNKIKIIISTIG